MSLRFNKQTARNDFFQNKLKESPEDIEAKALLEFDGFVSLLRSKGLNVQVFDDDSIQFLTPDSIFPSNWFVSLEPNRLVLCPMFAPDKRHERTKFLGELVGALGKHELQIYDMTHYEHEHRLLEGTSAMVLDRVNKKAYGCLSQRCDEGLFREFCSEFGYKAVPFHGFQTYQGKRVPIYHTNMMMGIGEKFTVVCLDAIDDPDERKTVVDELAENGKEIVDMSESETDHCAGNEIEVEGAGQQRYTVLTHSTFNELTEDQKDVIRKSSELIVGDVQTIEDVGGGSVRCMISELF